MFESETTGPLSASDVVAARCRLALNCGQGLSEAEHIDQIAAMEQLKAALAAAQARLAASLRVQRSSREATAGVPANQRCRGLAAEIALARRESPVRGARCLGLATALVQEMPHTLAALTGGEISEWRATLMVRETAVLSREHRAQVDRELSADLATLGDRQLVAAARGVSYRLDPSSALRRIKGAQADRRVSLRPAPDTMTCLTGFLPVAAGVACWAALTRHADATRARGDVRSRGQIMADRLVALVTGAETADGPAIEISLVMPSGTLLGDDQTPAHLRDYGPVPASTARDMVREASTVWVRRLFTAPGTSTLTNADSRRRFFSGQLRDILVLRDQFCRTPWCDAPIRHVDHILGAASGGVTSLENGQGLCEACNYTKAAPDWSADRSPGTRHSVKTTTPTGQTYLSVAPSLAGSVARLVP